MAKSELVQISTRLASNVGVLKMPQGSLSSRFLPLKLTMHPNAFYPPKAVALVGREHLKQVTALA
jgi:hypothetical protein